MILRSTLQLEKNAAAAVAVGMSVRLFLICCNADRSIRLMVFWSCPWIFVRLLGRKKRRNTRNNERWQLVLGIFFLLTCVRFLPTYTQALARRPVAVCVSKRCALEGTREGKKAILCSHKQKPKKGGGKAWLHSPQPTAQIYELCNIYYFLFAVHNKDNNSSGSQRGRKGRGEERRGRGRGREEHTADITHPHNH